MIQMYNVSKIYPNGVTALENINLRIRKGDFLFLVGPSGAGKTTVTRLIFREELPTRGQIIFNGKNIARLRPGEVPFHRRKVGVVFQDFRLLPQKSIYENVTFALEVTGAFPKEIKRRSLEVLRLVDLEKKSKMLPHQLSGGSSYA